MLIMGATMPQAPAFKARLRKGRLSDFVPEGWLFYIWTIELFGDCKNKATDQSWSVVRYPDHWEAGRVFCLFLFCCFVVCVFVYSLCFVLCIMYITHLMRAGVLSATRTIGKQAGNFSNRCKHSNEVRSSNRPDKGCKMVLLRLTNHVAGR